MADPPGPWTLVISRKAKKSAAKQSSNTNVAPPPRAAGMQRRSQEASASSSATIAGPSDTSRDMVSRRGKRSKTKQSNTAHIAPRLSPETPAIIPVDALNFPSLLGAAIVPEDASPQVAQSNTAPVAEPPKTFSFASVTCKALGKPVPKNDKAAYMPSRIATKMPCNAGWNIRQVMVAGAKIFVRLPEDLRIIIHEQSVPERVQDFHMVGPRNEPSFMSFLPVAHLGTQVDRLNYIKTLLRNTTLHISTVEDLQNLHKWLATIDFAPLDLDDLRNGFDAVRHLSFSDLLDMYDWHLPIPYAEYNSDGTSPAHFWEVAYDTWAMSSCKLVLKDCVILMGLCKDLHSLDLRARLSAGLMERLHETDSMTALLGSAEGEVGSSQEYIDDPDALQIVRLLGLQGLGVLRVVFYAPWYESAKLSEEKLRMVAHWLEERFDSRGQKVKVELKSEWHEDFHVPT